MYLSVYDVIEAYQLAVDATVPGLPLREREAVISGLVRYAVASLYSWEVM